MDPIGFALENYDGIGRWRDKDNGKPIDSSGQLYTGETFSGAGELKRVLSSATREAMARAAMRRGWVHPISPFFPLRS